MTIDRIGAQVVCRFTPDEALQLAEITEKKYDEEINPHENLHPVNYDLCDFLWDISTGLQKSAEE